MITAKKELDIVKITELKEDSDKTMLGKVAVLMESDHSNSDELLFRFLDNKSYFSFLSDEVQFEKVGYIEAESLAISFVDQLFDYPHLVKANNTQNELIIAGNVSRINSLTYVQLNENFLLGYVGTHKDDQNASAYPTADVYFFVKIGEVEGKTIYRYSSDMFLSDERKDISWILGFGSMKVTDPKTNVNVVKVTQYKE